MKGCGREVGLRAHRLAWVRFAELLNLCCDHSS